MVQLPGGSPATVYVTLTRVIPPRQLPKHVLSSVKLVQFPQEVEVIPLVIHSLLVVPAMVRGAILRHRQGVTVLVVRARVDGRPEGVHFLRPVMRMRLET